MVVVRRVRCGGRHRHSTLLAPATQPASATQRQGEAALAMYREPHSTPPTHTPHTPPAPGGSRPAAPPRSRPAAPPAGGAAAGQTGSAPRPPAAPPGPARRSAAGAGRRRPETTMTTFREGGWRVTGGWRRRRAGGPPRCLGLRLWVSCALWHPPGAAPRGTGPTKFQGRQTRPFSPVLQLMPMSTSCRCFDAIRLPLCDNWSFSRTVFPGIVPPALAVLAKYALHHPQRPLHVPSGVGSGTRAPW